MNKYTIGAIIILVLIGISFMVAMFWPGADKLSEPVETPTETIVEPELPPEPLITYQEILSQYFNPNIKYYAFDTKEEVLIAQQAIEDYMLLLYSIANAEENRIEAIGFIKPEITRIQTIQAFYSLRYNELVIAEIEAAKWAKRAEEYPTATAVWKHLTEVMGCNEYVAAGIIGNMMAECGGQTLSLSWRAMNATGHYGLCQWSTGFTGVRGADLQGQLNFMTTSFPQQIDRWGDICYKDGFTYEDFMAMEDAAEAAYAFCVIYERPGPGSYNQRRANALKALEYFTS